MFSFSTIVSKNFEREEYFFFFFSDDAKVAQSESGTKDNTEVTKNDGSVESLEENPDVKKVAATIKPIKKTEETSSTGNENNVEAINQSIKMLIL